MLPEWTQWRSMNLTQINVIQCLLKKFLMRNLDYPITGSSLFPRTFLTIWLKTFLYSSRPGADCGSDHELLIAKFRLKSKKVGKTTRPFRYDLNQIPYDYTVEVRNRFTGLDLIDRVPDELWMEVHDMYRRQGSRPSPWKRNAENQNGCLRRPYK